MTTRFKSILVSTTEGCDVGCAHCGFLGSSRDKDADEASLLRWIGDIGDYGIPTIIFTGGESFERFETLEAAVRKAHRAGVGTAVFTSSFWAGDRDCALDRMNRLRGLGQIYLSTDVYHQLKVPVQNVRNAIDASLATGVGTVSIVITYSSTADLERVKSWYAEYGDRLDIIEERVIPTPFTKKLLRGEDERLGLSQSDYAMRCWLDTPIVNPDGNVFACHVGKAGAHRDMREIPYWLGNLAEESFGQMMARVRRRADYQFLRVHGPKGVAEVVEATPDLRRALDREAFTCACDMCFSVLSTPEGAAALRQYTRQPDIRARINARLVLTLREAPVEDHEWFETEAVCA
ncbi:radical SAM protein [Erythrobacter sp. JK5]|uniref:radical SAM protein n=1 Tax=Erythrobacter sp. JK5 TaxID=2829500 RepID=UPI001BA96226|nr:radical SAM protein [Erythrobacter sp. JK5]QUL37960.1 radical SAM protein [Erythrobacter sp. JK5]